MAELVKPRIKYKESILEALAEYKKEKRKMQFGVERWTAMEVADLRENFQNFLEKIDNDEKGVNMKPGRVPQTELWLVEGDRYIGNTKIRHFLDQNLLIQGGHIGYSIRPSERKKGYGTLILKLALPNAKKLGIDRVLVTCDDDNIASAKIIEKNGGVMEDKVINELGVLKRRYWIENK